MRRGLGFPSASSCWGFPAGGLRMRFAAAAPSAPVGALRLRPGTDATASRWALEPALVAEVGSWALVSSSLPSVVCGTARSLPEGREAAFAAVAAALARLNSASSSRSDASSSAVLLRRGARGFGGALGLLAAFEARAPLLAPTPPRPLLATGAADSSSTSSSSMSLSCALRPPRLVVGLSGCVVSSSKSSYSSSDIFERCAESAIFYNSSTINSMLQSRLWRSTMRLRLSRTSNLISDIVENDSTRNDDGIDGS